MIYTVTIEITAPGEIKENVELRMAGAPRGTEWKVKEIKKHGEK